MNKLEKNELEELQAGIHKINNLQLQIGGLEAQKHELLHAITEASKEFQSKQSELQDKYGKVDIDISTGEIKERDESIKED